MEYYFPQKNDEGNPLRLSLMMIPRKANRTPLSKAGIITATSFLSSSEERLPKLKNQFSLSNRIKTTQSKKPEEYQSGQEQINDKDTRIEPKIQTLDSILRVLQESNHSLDITKVVTLLEKVVTQLGTASKTEILLNKSEFNNKTLNQDYASIKSNLLKTEKQLKLQQNEFLDLRNKLISSANSERKYEQLAKHEKLKNEELTRKIRNLEERLEFALEKNLGAHQDSLHTTLNTLIKENEQLKRDKITYQKEIERLKEYINKLNDRNSTLNKKLDSLKVKKINKDDGSDSLSQVPTTVLESNQLPKSLNFRLMDLPQRYKGTFQDVLDHGPEAFGFRIVNTDDKIQKQELSLNMAKQFLSFKIFSDKLNMIFHKLLELSNVKSIKELICRVGREFKTILQSEIIQLWISDEQTGHLYSYDASGNLIKCLCEKGLFHQILKEPRIYNQIDEEDVVLYQDLQRNGCDVSGSHCILLPLYDQDQRVYGILELNKIFDEKYCLDEQYLGMMIGMFSKTILATLIDQQINQRILKYKEIGYNEFMNLCSQTSKQRFIKCVFEFAYKMFFTLKCSFLVIDRKKRTFQKYLPDGTIDNIDQLTGVAGWVAVSQKSYITLNITKELNYHSRVDLDTFCPVYSCPITTRCDQNNVAETLAVLQFVIKKKARMQRLTCSQHYGQSHSITLDSVETDAAMFANLVSTAYMLVESQIS